MDNIVFVPGQFLSTLSLRRATLDPLETLIILPFLSTLSLRRATTWARGSRVTYVISIHALLAESDGILLDLTLHKRDFYPRSPCGERPMRRDFKALGLLFLSTLSLRRAT